MDRFPLSQNDHKRFRMTDTTHWLESAHNACFDVCEQNNELTFLSIQEGKCFRNCISKLNFLTPHFGKQYIGTAFEQRWNDYREARADAGYPEVNFNFGSADAE